MALGGGVWLRFLASERPFSGTPWRTLVWAHYLLEVSGFAVSPGIGTTFTLDGENGTGHTPYVTGGFWVARGEIIAATRTDGPVVITTASDHGLATGETVFITDVQGMTKLNETKFEVTFISHNSFSLNGTVGTFHTDNDYTLGGKWSNSISYTIPAQPDRGILAGISIDVDRRSGPDGGSIYVSFVDQADMDGDNDRGLRGSPATSAEADHDDTDIFAPPYRCS